MRILSPDESIPALPARPIICLYWVRLRKALPTYGLRKITLKYMKYIQEWIRLKQYKKINSFFFIKRYTCINLFFQQRYQSELLQRAQTGLECCLVCYIVNRFPFKVLTKKAIFFHGSTKKMLRVKLFNKHFFSLVWVLIQ